MSRRILLVDDEPGEFTYVNFLLKDQYGDAFTIHHSRTVDEARQHLSRNGIDVILLDDRLDNGQTALDSIPQIKRSAFNVRIVVISKNANSRHLRELAKMKTCEVIDKFNFRDALAQGLLD